MTDWDFVLSVLGPVTRDFTAWVQRWVPGEDGAAYAARSLGALLYDAAAGQETSYGPYRMLYANGEWNLRQHERLMKGDVPFGIWRTIPVPSPTLICDLTRVYIYIHMGAEYGQLSAPEINLLYRMTTKLRYNSSGQYAMPAADPDIPAVAALLDRMSNALDTHRRSCRGDCAPIDQLWHDEDIRSMRWLGRFAAESRDTFNGF